MRRSLLVLVLAAALAGCGGSDTPGDTRVETGGISFDVPPAWELVNEESLALVEGDPDAAVRRKDGSAILTFKKGGEVPGRIGPAGVALQKELQKRVPDLRALRGSEVKTRAGNAYVFDLVRDQPEGPARVAEVPTGDGSWVLELSVQPRAAEAKGESARIIRSFDD